MIAGVLLEIDKEGITLFFSKQQGRHHTRTCQIFLVYPFVPAWLKLESNKAWFPGSYHMLASQLLCSSKYDS
jgi:hypothetical protein